MRVFVIRDSSIQPFPASLMQPSALAPGHSSRSLRQLQHAPTRCSNTTDPSTFKAFLSEGNPEKRIPIRMSPSNPPPSLSPPIYQRRSSRGTPRVGMVSDNTTSRHHDVLHSTLCSIDHNISSYVTITGHPLSFITSPSRLSQHVLVYSRP